MSLCNWRKVYEGNLIPHFAMQKMQFHDLLGLQKEEHLLMPEQE